MTCRKPHPHPGVLLFCEEAAGHKGPHRTSTVAAGEYVSWPQESYVFADGINALAKLKGNQ